MSTPAERAAVSWILQHIARPIIIELGAHKGEDSKWLAQFTPALQICVEPDPENYAVLHDVVENLPGVRGCWAAIAAEAGFVEFHACDNSSGIDRASGSIRKPTGHLEHFPWCKFERTLRVPSITLDQLATPLPQIDLLWVDIQGAERDMIEGGREALEKTRWLFIEAEEVEMYEGQALRPELLAMLPDFEVAQAFDYNLLLRHK